MKLFYGSIFPHVAFHPDEVQHITKVLRIKEGTELHLTDGQGNSVRGVLTVQGKKVGLADVEHLPKQDKNPFQLHIAMAPTKNIDRTEFFLEKAVEMRVDEITFLLTDHSERKNINLERLEKQAIAASKQSLRMHFPKIHPLTKLTDFIKNHAENIFVTHCHERFERVLLTEFHFDEKNTFLVGPEGDFSPREIEMLSEKNIKAVSLGDQRLRTETAGIFLAAWNYQRGFSK